MSQQSIIGQGTVVRGNVSGLGSLEIQGRVEGDVTVTGDVIVQPGALVKGNVRGNQLSVAGSVAGNLTATEGLVLEPGSKVIGDLVAISIGIAEGALVRGLVRTADEPPLEVAKASAPTAARSPATLQRPGVGGVARPAAIAGNPARAAFAPRPAASVVAGPKPVPLPLAVPQQMIPPPGSAIPGADASEDPSHAEDQDQDGSDEFASDPANIDLESESEAKAAAARQNGDGPPPPYAPALKKSQKAKKKGR
jgi:cytoskeletal protein CcmA (bactofilin family)